MKEHVHFIITGGTIDSVFDGPRDMIVPAENSLIAPFFERVIRPHFDLSHETVAMKDSRQIDEHDRRAMAKAIVDSKHDKIILTHGTYTMPETLTYLSENLDPGLPKCVIVTGSMLPLEGFAPSDAGFNLGFAIASAFGRERGLFLCMNGQLFDPGTVIKMVDQGKFIAKDD